MTESHPEPTGFAPNLPDINLRNLLEELTVDDWPIGNGRGTAEFTLETSPTYGERIARRTRGGETGRLGTWGKPRRTIYFRVVRIAVCRAGRTWIVGLTGFGNLAVIPGTMHPTTFHDLEGAPPGVAAIAAKLRELEA